MIQYFKGRVGNPSSNVALATDKKLKEIQNAPIIFLRFHQPVWNQYHNPPPTQSSNRYHLVAAYNVLWHKSGAEWLFKLGLITDFTGFL